MKKLSLSQIAGMSCMIFAIFFGAGNMIFPPSMGQQAGTNAPIALLGFVLSDVGIAVAGVLAVVLAGTSMYELASRISPRFAKILSLTVYLCIGPLFALPRCGSVSFEIGIIPFLDGFDPKLASFLFTFAFFGITLLLSLRKGKVVDIVGKVLTPILLLCILTLFIGVIVSPLGEVGVPRGDYQSIPFFKGVIEGYLALDGFAGLVFAILIVHSLKAFQISEHKQVVKYTIICTSIAAVLLIAVYTILLIIGIQTSSMELFANGGNLLTYVTNTLFGKTGNLILALTVTLACLTTSIGLSTSFSDYLCNEYPKLSYLPTLIGVCLFSFIIANVGLNQLIIIVQPLLVTIYPIVTILALVSLLTPYLKEHTANAMKCGMLFVLPFSFMDGMKTAHINIPFFSDLMKNMPLFSVGLGWLLPAIIGCTLGYFLHYRGNKRTLPR